MDKNLFQPNGVNTTTNPPIWETIPTPVGTVTLQYNSALDQPLPKEGLRFNEGKARLDLVPQSAIDGIADVLGFGAKKYAPNNWRKGMQWSKITASLHRHMAAIERGEDYDSESGLLHIDHVLTNAAFLKEYYKTYPQGDDRPHKYLNHYRLALDIDEVLCDFTGGWAELYDDVPARPTAWNYDRNIGQRFKKMEDAGTLDDFYLGLKPKIDPMDIPIEPTCYITSRPVSTNITEQWLDMHGFPRVKVITVPYGKSKVDALKENNINLFVDDSFDNFREANKAGICTYLYSAPHNTRFSVGHKRLKSLKDLV